MLIRFKVCSRRINKLSQETELESPVVTVLHFVIACQLGLRSLQKKKVTLCQVWMKEEIISYAK